MATKLILIVGISVAAVVGMFFLGKYMDKGNAEDSSLRMEPRTGD